MKNRVRWYRLKVYNRIIMVYRGEVNGVIVTLYGLTYVNESKCIRMALSAFEIM